MFANLENQEFVSYWFARLERRGRYVAIVGEYVSDFVQGLDCGENLFNGFTIAISINRSKSSARREASTRTRILRNRQWREIRRLRCPLLDCRRREVTHVLAQGPTYWFEIRLWVRIWVVAAVRRWEQAVECQYPEG